MERCCADSLRLVGWLPNEPGAGKLAGWSMEVELYQTNAPAG